ncbi:MAG: T9SS type A sorting domain-containing protein [bacterium]|nr:T9SS type A sorting domain-containing protein [bacterium]
MVKADVIPEWYWGNDAGDYMIRAIVDYVGVEENADFGLGSGELKINPNPIIGKTVISYSGNKSTNTLLTIYDISGKLVKSFPMVQSSNKQMTNLTWDTKDNTGKKVSAGIYFCKLRTGTDISTKTLVVL